MQFIVQEPNNLHAKLQFKVCRSGFQHLKRCLAFSQMILFSQPPTQKEGAEFPASMCLRAEHPCPCHALNHDAGLVSVWKQGGLSRNNSIGVCVVQPLTCNDKGRGASAAHPLTVLSSGEILFYGFSGESSQALMCVWQGTRNKMTDREPQGREEGKGPALRKRSVKHPDLVSAQPKATSLCPNDAVGCQTTALHHKHCGARTVMGADVLSHPALCLGCPTPWLGSPSPCSPTSISKPETPFHSSAGGCSCPRAGTPTYPVGSELRWHDPPSCLPNLELSTSLQNKSDTRAMRKGGHTTPGTPAHGQRD